MDTSTGIGITLALVAAFASGVESLLRRKIAIKINPLVCTFLFQGFAALFLLPLFITRFTQPYLPHMWWLVVISGMLWAFASLAMFKAYSYLEASTGSIISRSKIILILFLSIIFLKESLNALKILGTLLIFLGLVILYFKKGGRVFSLKDKGVQFMMLSILLFSFALLIDKTLVKFFDPGALAFLLYAIPTFVLFFIVVGKKSSFTEITIKNISTIALTSLLSASFYFTVLSAFRFAEANVVIPLTELSSLVTVFGGILFLKERSHIKKKILAAIIVVIGAILIGLS